MRHEFCSCVHPIVDTEEPWRCHRCGNDVSLFRIQAEGLAPAADPLDGIASLRADLITLGRMQRQGLIDTLEPAPAPVWDEAGFVRVEVLIASVVTVLAAVAVAVWLWQYLVGAGVMYAAFRHLTRHTRRRRPRSSWSSLGRTAAMLYAAYNSRGLVQRNGRPLRVSVPASAGRQHVDEYGEVPF